MATLVLTAVGGVLGGPLGAALGAAAGSAIDGRLFAGKGATGARLSSLAVQSSTYGAELPRLFGTLRVAGSVIWSTDLSEDTHHASTGKGRSSATTYSYSASFAVALSARPILRVGRIWADGNLLRGAAGDWKSDLGAFRLHLGDEGQAPDPLIAAAEDGAVAAHRGLAYAVFEHLQLADFGNRLPSLTFEVTADEGTVTLGAIAAELSGGDVRAAAAGPALAGYAAGGDSVRAALDVLAAALPVAFAADADALRLVDEGAAPVAIDPADLGARLDDAATPRVAVSIRSAGTLNETVELDYYDPARDWQVGSQRARRGAGGRRAAVVQLPAALAAADARATAEALLDRSWTARREVSLALPPRWLGIAAGTIVAVPGEGGRWRVTRRGFERGVVTLAAVQVPGAAPAASLASAGRATAQPDLVQGQTVLALLDLPPLADEPATAPALAIAAAGDGPGWRRASLLGSANGGATWAALGDTAPAAVIGTAVEALPAGATPFLVDEAGTLTLDLLHDGMTLAGDDRLGWSAAANLLLVGDELVQFGTATQLAPARWRIGRLLRGRRGTEGAIAGHVAGERAVLLDPATLLAWPLPAAALGAQAEVAATGRGDATPALAACAVAGRSLLPLAPVHLAVAIGADGGIVIGWTRRSRAGWAWTDGGDVPLAEESERYRLVVARGGASRELQCTAPVATFDRESLAALGAGPLTLAVTQLGTWGESPIATLVVPEEAA